MAMCVHSGEFETCQFGCTFRSAEELRLENDQLKKKVKKMEKQKSCSDRDCEFLRHGVCVAEECVWQLTKAEENYEAMMADLTPESPK